MWDSIPLDQQQNPSVYVPAYKPIKKMINSIDYALRQ